MRNAHLWPLLFVLAADFTDCHPGCLSSAVKPQALVARRLFFSRTFFLIELLNSLNGGWTQRFHFSCSSVNRGHWTKGTAAGQEASGVVSWKGYSKTLTHRLKLVPAGHVEEVAVLKTWQMLEWNSENFQMMAVKLSLIKMTVYGPNLCSDNTLYLMQGVD